MQYAMSRTGKSIETESRVVIAWGWEGWKDWGAGVLLGQKLECGDGCTTLYRLKAIQLNNLNEQIGWNVDYISISW